MLERYFKLSENGTTVRTELLAGITTFATMAYIIFVQPAVLSGKAFGSETGMDFGAVTTATCLSAALATTIMALYGKYPIAQAPGMGENFFFVFSVVPAAMTAGFKSGWQVALGAVFVSGIIFLVLSAAGLREMIFNSVSPSMRNTIAAGIGLFIAFIGLQNAGLILKDPGSAVKLNAHFASPDLIIFFVGLFAIAVLQARGVRGAMLWGVVTATILAVVLRLGLPRMPSSLATSPLVKDSALMTRFALPGYILSMPPSLAPTFLQANIRGALSSRILPFVFVFLFMLTFDAIGTVAGAALGTSTVTSFIESAAGVEQGGRTGLMGLVVAVLFLLALFFSPLIAMVGNYPALTAPALVVVGAMMVRNVAQVDWKDATEAIPAFLVLVGIPLSYSIADGLALGFISYPVIKLFSGRGRETPWLTHVLAIVLLLYFILVRSGIG